MQVGCSHQGSAQVVTPPNFAHETIRRQLPPNWWFELAVWRFRGSHLPSTRTKLQHPNCHSRVP